MIPRTHRFTVAEPCPACGRPARGRNDWCFRTSDGASFWCGRAATLAGKPGRPHKSGWFHDLPGGDAAPPRLSAPMPRRRAEPAPDFAALARRFRNALTPGRLQHLAGKLGLGAAALTRLRVGWASRADLAATGTGLRGDDDGAWSFPMEDGAGNVVGIRLRAVGGGKFAVRCSDGAGMFVPHQPPLGPGLHLLLPEGPTSAGALLQLGFAAVGRPNCRAGIEHLRVLIRRLQPARVVVFGDNDEQFNETRGVVEWPGRDGAAAVAANLAVACRDVVVALPPPGIKDARAWVLAGARVSDVWDRIDELLITEGAGA